MNGTEKLADEVFGKMYGFDIKHQSFDNFEDHCHTSQKPDDVQDIENTVLELVPFIKESLLRNYLVLTVDGKRLSDIIDLSSIQFLPEYKNFDKSVVICRAIAFKNYRPKTVGKTLFDMNPFLMLNYGIAISKNTEPLLGGFENLAKYKNRRRMCTIRFYLVNRGENANRNY